MNHSDWPELVLDDWVDTRATLQLWTQIVGKVRLALEPMLNHWWQVPLYVSARGLTTSLMHSGTSSLEIEFDFVTHLLVARAATGVTRQIELRERTTAEFYAEVLSLLDELGVEIHLLGRPVEMAVVIPFSEDTQHRAYDPGSVERFWQLLLQAHRVMSRFRARFIGKASPVHFFWGAADLAATRFSGRPAPLHPGGVPNCPDWVQQMAYSHEVSSCGFWPGGSEEGMFYSYAYPEPPGFGDAAILPAAAHYDPALGEFLLPYRALRVAPDPDAMLLDFLQSTYEAAADLAGWDRAALEMKGAP